MKICFVCGEYPPMPHGGIGTMTQVLGRALARQGHDVRVIGVYPSTCSAPEFEIDSGVRVWRLRDSLRRGGWIVSRYRLNRQISAWVRDGAIDMVEVPDYHGWSAGWRPMKAPVLVRLHGSMTYFAAELDKPANRIAYLLERSCLRRADFACSVSRYTLEMTRQLFKLDLDPCEVLYNPVELPPGSSETPRKRYRVVFSGTLTGKKGIVALIKAWPKVVSVHHDAELHVFGKNGRADDGQPMESVLCSILNGTRPSVHFHGHVSRRELFEAYLSAGLAVFPSRAEAFAIAPLESMASGCPTIYTQRGSGSELLEHGREGLLVDPDNPDEIAEAIIRVQADPSTGRALGDAGRARVRKDFSIDKLTTRNIAFYEQCLKNFRQRYCA
jgi:glycosyltransferase involved in cell wall biosynthesis